MFTRACPTCGVMLTYSHKQSMFRKEREGASCRTCSDAERVRQRTLNPTVADVAVLDLHKKGLGNRGIAAELDINHALIKRVLDRHGRTTNNPRGAPPEPVDDRHSRCFTCSEVVPNEEFALVKSRSDGRRLSKCRRCRNAQMRAARVASPEAFFADRCGRLKARATKLGLDFDLVPEFLVGLFETQGEQCFYTDAPLDIGLGTSDKRRSIAVDRVDNYSGYVQSNVVLCLSRINSIKDDVTLEEMGWWMPDWYGRVVECSWLEVADGNF